jgi:hypothetical protein
MPSTTGFMKFTNFQENIVNKTNVKLGGLNYNIISTMGALKVGKDDLFLGLALNHVAGGLGNLEVTKRASILGVSFNELSSTFFLVRCK